MTEGVTTLTATAQATPLQAAADRLDDLDYHLSRYNGRPDALARHLRSDSHDLTLHVGRDSAEALALLHQAGHQAEADAACTALQDAQDALADQNA